MPVMLGTPQGISKPQPPRSSPLRPSAQQYAGIQTVRSATAEKMNLRRKIRAGQLDETVLTDLGALLERFDGTTGRSTEGRRLHVAASLELQRVTHELLRIVDVLDSCIRLRLEAQPELLAEWTQTSSVVSTPKHTPEPAKAPAEVKPAA